jgi:hypothetical protein
MDQRRTIAVPSASYSRVHQKSACEILYILHVMPEVKNDTRAKLKLGCHEYCQKLDEFEYRINKMRHSIEKKPIVLDSGQKLFLNFLALLCGPVILMYFPRDILKITSRCPYRAFGRH